jgi:DNA primase
MRRGWQGHQLPNNWRDRLPEPARYYRTRIDKLGAHRSNGWAQGRCPFHEDRNASLSVNLDNPRGHWRCFAGCGSGDLLAFHMRLSGLGFADAVRDLVGGV